MKSRLLLDIVVAQSTSILQLLSGKDQSLLVGGNTAPESLISNPSRRKGTVHHAPLLILDLGLDSLDAVRGLDLEGDGLARKGLDEDLHLRSRAFMGRRCAQRRTYYC